MRHTQTTVELLGGAAPGFVRATRVLHTAGARAPRRLGFVGLPRKRVKRTLDVGIGSRTCVCGDAYPVGTRNNAEAAQGAAPRGGPRSVGSQCHGQLDIALDLRPVSYGNSVEVSRDALPKGLDVVDLRID